MREQIVLCGESDRENPWTYLGEVTHRTMNDYTLLAATLRRAAAGISDQATKQALAAIDEKIRAAACAHRSLCPPRDEGPRQFDDQLQTLCGALSVSLLSGRDITLSLYCEPVVIDANQSWRASLIIYELVLNAAKHAFVGGQAGAIAIDMRVDHGDVRCAVCDSGGGPRTNASGLGGAIVDLLAAHLNGRILRSHSGAGSLVTLCFPYEAARYC